MAHTYTRASGEPAGGKVKVDGDKSTHTSSHAHTQTTHTPHTTALTRGQARWKRMWIWVYAEIVWAQALAICYHCLCAVLAVEMENWIRNTKLNFRLWNGRAARKFDIIVPNVDDIERRKLLQRSDTTQKVDTAALRAGNKIWEIFRGQSLICGWQLIPGRAPRGNYSYRFPSDTINKHRVYAALAQAQFINCHASPRWLTWPSWAFLFLFKKRINIPQQQQQQELLSPWPRRWRGSCVSLQGQLCRRAPPACPTFVCYECVNLIFFFSLLLLFGQPRPDNGLGSAWLWPGPSFGPHSSAN